MSTPGWRTSLIVQGYDLQHGQPVPVVVGLVDTANDSTQISLRVGERGRTVILPLQVANQHLVNLREVMVERLRIVGEMIGGDEP